MFRSVDIVSRRPLSIILTGFILCFTVPLLFFHSGPFQQFEGWVKDSVKTGHGMPKDTPPLLPDFFEWDTRTSFEAMDANYARTASVAELCKSFPSHLLKDIQPVLKTGHAVIHDRLLPQLQSVSACLDNLLIFSDLNEKFQGYEIIDTIADIPSSRLQGEREQKQLDSYFTLQDFAANNSLSQLNTTELKGWKTDKFKFLPAITRVWRMRPERRWYVFYEDDTYVFWDNLFRLLEHFDADVPLYFGSPSPGCYPQPEDHPDIQVWFGNGGPGFILSREAMRRLVRHDWDPKTGEYIGPRLQELHWEETLKDCCGDSLLGCVLWMNDVTLSGLWPMFNVHPPHRMPFSKNTWCQPALTMHKPLAEDLTGIWQWEWEHRQVDRPLIWRDMAITYWNMTNLTTMNDWDNTGRSSFAAHEKSEYHTHDPHESPEACERACQANPKCLQWMYHLRTCTLDKHMRYGEKRDPELEKVGKEVSEENAQEDWNREQLRYRSGWMQDNIRQWVNERPCDKVEWVRPSLERVF